MKVTVDLKYFLIAIAAFVIAFMTVTYKIDKYISFAGEDNAFAFFTASLFIGALSLFCSFEKTNKDK
tara:strand:- start:324 stop:524 length:201 start_codon:yes stop_codon:yes gene_type:complete